MSSCALKALEGGDVGDNLLVYKRKKPGRSGALMQVRCERLGSEGGKGQRHGKEGLGK